MKLFSRARVSVPSSRALLRPRLACEISPAGVAAGRLDRGGSDLVAAFSALPPGAVSPGLKAANLAQPETVIAALRRALDEVAQREATLTLVVPDAAIRVLILDFDSLPAKRSEALPILRFRLRKLVPFDVESSAVSYQVISAGPDVVRTVAAVMPGPVLKEYEDAVRGAGYEPGAVLPSTLAALAAVDGGAPALVVNRSGHSITTAITNQNALLLYRTIELSAPLGSQRQEADRQISAATAPLLARPRTLNPEAAVFGGEYDAPLGTAPLEASASLGTPAAVAEAQTAILVPPDSPLPMPGQDPAIRAYPMEEQGEELRTAINVAVAYFEDTLGSRPDLLWAAGPGGARELVRMLDDPTIAVRDLVPIETGATTPIPPGLHAGVEGALAV